MMLPRHGVRTARICGYEFELDLSDFIQRNIYAGTFEASEAKVLMGRLAPGMTFIDVGANVGYFTALAARCVGPTGLVVALEPSPYLSNALPQ
jgi:protein-L-isoaspartate O-methyltransferase